MRRPWVTDKAPLLRLGADAKEDLGRGSPPILEMGEILRQLEVSAQTYQRWRKQYQGMAMSDVARLRALEKENRRLKKIAADQVLDNDMLKELAQGKW